MMSSATKQTVAPHETLSNIDLTISIFDPIVISYLSQFDTEEAQVDKTLEALKVGVIAIQSAAPALDTRIVEAKFADLESRLRDSVDEFQLQVQNDLACYFKDNDGVIPKSLNGVFGTDGQLSRTFQSFFDPSDGRLARLMQAQIGPQSTFGRALDPKNKEGILTLIECRVQDLVQSKIEEVLAQLSLDEESSAMSRLKKMLTDHFRELNTSLGVRSATAEEAEKGHVKGLVFETDVYEVFAAIGRSLGDETEFVRGTPGVLKRKTGDYVATLGETSGAPGVRLTVEVKDQPVKLKAAIDELQEAKRNREAVSGIYVFAKGCEPAEVGDFHRIGEDFYCTIDKNDVQAGKPLTFLEAAYKISRAMAIVAARKAKEGTIDLLKIENHIDALLTWSKRITDAATKARTIQKSGEAIESLVNDLKADMDERLADILSLLHAAE